MKKILFSLFLLTFIGKGFSQGGNDVLNLLISNKTISQKQADSIRAEAAIKQQKADSAKSSFPVEALKKIKISGYTQLRYQNFGDQTKADAFDIRRARLSLKGDLSPFWSYNVQFELANTPKLLDAYAEYKFANYLRIQGGNVKTPLSLENNTATDKLESIDFSQVVEALCSRSQDVIGNFSGLDLGVKIVGDLVKIKDYNLLSYSIGIFNGSGINFSDNNKAKDFGGRLVLQPIKGLKVGGSYYDGWATITSAPVTTVTTTTTTTNAFKSTSVSTLKTTTTSVSQIRSRLGVDLSYDLNNLSVRTEYIKGVDGKDASLRYVRKEGYYAQVGYFVFPKKLQVLLKYDDYDKNTYIPGDITTNYILMFNYNFTPLVRIQAGYYFGDKSNRPFKGIALNSANNLGVVQFQIGF